MCADVIPVAYFLTTTLQSMRLPSTCCTTSCIAIRIIPGVYMREETAQSYVLTKGWSWYDKEKHLDTGDVTCFERVCG